MLSTALSELPSIPVGKTVTAMEERIDTHILASFPALMEHQVKICLHIPVGLHLCFPFLITQVSLESQL